MYNSAVAGTERALSGNLKTRCATQLPRLNGATGKDAAELLIVYLEIYGQCAARHNQLVDEINLRERVIYGTN